MGQEIFIMEKSKGISPIIKLTPKGRAIFDREYKKGPSKQQQKLISESLGLVDRLKKAWKIK